MPQTTEIASPLLVPGLTVASALVAAWIGAHASLAAQRLAQRDRRASETAAAIRRETRMTAIVRLRATALRTVLTEIAEIAAPNVAAAERLAEIVRPLRRVDAAEHLLLLETPAIEALAAVLERARLLGAVIAACAPFYGETWRDRDETSFDPRVKVTDALANAASAVDALLVALDGGGAAERE